MCQKSKFIDGSKKAVAPTQRSKVPPLLHECVEEGEAKEQLLPDGLLAGAVEEGGVGDGVAQVGAQQVGPQPLGRLVGHLQAVLQDADGELVRRVAGQPQPGGTEEETRTFFTTSHLLGSFLWGLVLLRGPT